MPRTDSTYFRTAASADSGLQVLAGVVASATVAMTVNLREDVVGGTVIARVIVPANDTRVIDLSAMPMYSTGTWSFYVEIAAGTGEVTLFGR